MRLALLLVTLPLTVLAVAFAVTNRHAVPLNLWPFRLELQAPLFLMVLGALLLGVALGLLAGWLGAGRTRRRLRLERERAERLEAEVARLRRDEALTQAPPVASLPPAARPSLRLAGGGFGGGRG